VGAGNGGKSRGSARADDNQPKSGNNTSRNGGSGGRDSGSRGSDSGSGNGDGNNGGGNVGGNTAAIEVVMAAPTVGEGAADVGGDHLSNYCITVRTDVITIIRRLAKH